MIKNDPRPLALRMSGGLFASAAVLVGIGCGGQGYYAEPVAPTSGYVVASPPPSGPEMVAGDVEYVSDAPVVDIETYPTVVYEGVPVYYVDGEWYRRDEHGWGHYRHEPRELSRQREEHDRDPQWAQARERHVAPPPQRDVAQPQVVDRRLQAPPVEVRRDVEQRQVAPPPPIAPRPPVALAPQQVAPAPQAAQPPPEAQPIPGKRRAPMPARRPMPMQEGPREPVRR